MTRKFGVREQQNNLTIDTILTVKKLAQEGAEAKTSSVVNT